MKDYNDQHAQSGLKAVLPKIETFPNQFPDYTIKIEIPEYTAVCPKTGCRISAPFYWNMSR